MTDDRLDDEPAHSRLGPSGADGWMVCHGKPNAEKGLPNESSEFAVEGQFAHYVSDECLSDTVLGLTPFDFIGQIYRKEGHVIEFDEDMAEALYPGLEWIRAQPGTFYGEHKVDLSKWLGPGQFGTLDRGIIAPKLITINDLKFGRGIPVSPVKNKQMMLYGLGFWWNVARHQTDATEFLFVIDQPRCAGGGGEWRCSLDELLAFGEEARAAAIATNDPRAPRVASEKGCFWCLRRKAPGGCDTFAAFNLDLMGTKFEDLDSDGPLILPSKMTPARRSHVLRCSKMIEMWIEQMHEDTLNDALAGNPTPTLKAVEGRKSPDKWSDKEKAAQVLEPMLAERAFSKRVITPKQAMEKISVEEIWEVEPLIIRGSKKPVLVPDADAREAIESHESKFDDVLC